MPAMKHLSTLKTLATLALGTLTSATWAHDGHGMQGSHWHATDVAGFAAVAVLVAVAIWLSRGGK